MIPIHLRLGLSSGLFPTNNLYTILFAPIRATCPAHFILLDLITGNRSQTRSTEGAGVGEKTQHALQ
jgi:hypothetical protein